MLDALSSLDTYDAATRWEMGPTWFRVGADTAGRIDGKDRTIGGEMAIWRECCLNESLTVGIAGAGGDAVDRGIERQERNTGKERLQRFTSL